MNSRNNNESSNMIAIAPSSSSPLAPNPLLSSSLPVTTATTNKRCPPSHKRQRHRGDKLSASIPLPKSHIHRTPSELQLADDKRRAEYEDVRMYARLVVGMQSQCMVSGYVHPLTKKSLQDILRTKDAEEEELETSANHHQHGEEENSCWELSFPDEDDENDGQGSVDSPLPCQPMGTSAKAPTVVKTPSTGSIISTDSTTLHQGKDDDECVFSLEL